ncbi:sortase-dependent protein [Streptomyces sp. DG2A-72]|uniref:sortase-dependent protein n=1 Tax=Streptomyces sp. DG2A-72 TaxID=3051386 RepID=UPI00265B96D0|nr:sortase-dependent protein [Streptomyces sp. DG2A-72]MDO0934829.1 sortase-dependent protein [Streptomyces sp. DG2A-72]
MRRTVLSVLALACTAVLAATAPALADEATTPAPKETAAPSPVPAEDGSPSAAPAEPTTVAPTEDAPSSEPTRAPRDQVSVVPSGAPDTGVTSGDSGPGAGMIGGGAAAVLGLSGAAVFVVRRRRATGA